jgi:hypothetical protein
MGRIEPVAREKTRWRVLAFSGWQVRHEQSISYADT